MISPEQHQQTPEHTWSTTLIDLLYHCEFERAMTAEGHQNFSRQLSRMARLKTSGVGELFIKLLPAAQNTHIDPKNLPWLGFRYDFIANEGSLQIEAKAVYLPLPDDARPEENPEFADCDFIMIDEADLNWPLP